MNILIYEKELYYLFILRIYLSKLFHSHLLGFKRNIVSP